jgi:hypothetical protein
VIELEAEDGVIVLRLELELIRVMSVVIVTVLVINVLVDVIIVGAIVVLMTAEEEHGRTTCEPCSYLPQRVVCSSNICTRLLSRSVTKISPSLLKANC